MGALFWVVSVAFAQPSKELIQEMQAMRALTVRMYEEDLIKDFTGFEDCKDFYFYKDAMERHAAIFLLEFGFYGQDSPAPSPPAKNSPR
ncbi:hypothetical protein [Helicobacter felis]|uniref:hypothetical protein n=1 Tax=Helicobacter felis TaxID=214 RepID=UPI0013151C53|nr:hypothetical protein [Helicobacter felis]